jgi:hypothetical protein
MFILYDTPWGSLHLKIVAINFSEMEMELHDFFRFNIFLKEIENPNKNMTIIYFNF